MSETTRTLPALLALLAGVCMVLITHSPVGLFVFGIIALAQYLQRKTVLNTVSKVLYVAGAGVFGAAAVMGAVLWVPQAILLAGLICAFCTATLYTRMAV